MQLPTVHAATTATTPKPHVRLTYEHEELCSGRPQFGQHPPPSLQQGLNGAHIDLRPYLDTCS